MKPPNGAKSIGAYNPFKVSGNGYFREFINKIREAIACRQQKKSKSATIRTSYIPV
jgi:hypothetical protein